MDKFLIDHLVEVEKETGIDVADLGVVDAVQDGYRVLRELVSETGHRYFVVAEVNECH